MTEGMAEVPCNLCGSNFTDLRYVIDGVRVVQCRVCDLVYRNPRNEAAARRRPLDQDAGPEALGQRADLERRLARLLRLVGRPGRLLDVGFGAGAFVEEARERGWAAMGVDADGLGIARLGSEVALGRLEDLPEGHRTFDAVTLWDTLGRVPDPKALIAKARERVSEGGVIALSAPNVASLAAWVGKGRWPMFGEAYLTYFAPETIRKMVVLSGFHILGVETHGLGLRPLSGASRHRLRGVCVERLMDVFLNLIQAGQVISVYARRRDRSGDASPDFTPMSLSSPRRNKRRSRAFGA